MTKPKTVLAAAGVCVAVAAVALADSPPTPPEIEFAEKVTDALQQRLFALLLDEFANTTPANVPQNTEAISLVFDNRVPTFRLVGEIDPLDETDVPQDTFEEDALAAALQGIPVEEVEKSKGKWYVRRSIPLQNFDPSCVLCHSAYQGFPADKYVGALMLRVPTSYPTKY